MQQFLVLYIASLMMSQFTISHSPFGSYIHVASPELVEVYDVYVCCHHLTRNFALMSNVHQLAALLYQGLLLDWYWHGRD